MTFTTATFVVFLAIVFTLYWTIRVTRWQNLLLLTASYIFYGWWDWRFCFLMLASSLVDYCIGLGLGSAARRSTRLLLLRMSVLLNLGLLGVFKYFHFFADSFREAASQLGWEAGPVTLQIILPVGISFYTFQTMSYTIDIYRRQLTPCRNLVTYLTFVSFFPQLVAGPIERAAAMIPQFASPRRFDHAVAAYGCRLILWGFAKKLMIADRLAIIVNSYYSDPQAFSGPELMAATVFFAFQIYCDFSAYSDIAVGVAKLFDVHLMRNFAYPYFSRSVAEFWRRWHISLSTWFRDYVFIPLGGSRCGPLRRTLNLILTFLISGLWHGAAWRFVIWGGINGVATAGTLGVGPGGRADEVPGGDRDIPSLRSAAAMLGTFAVICSAWVFFRAETFASAAYILRSIAVGLFSVDGYAALISRIAGDRFVGLTCLLLAGFVLWEWVGRRRECPLDMKLGSRPLRWAVYTVLIWTTLYMIPRSGEQEFIYFDF